MSYLYTNQGGRDSDDDEEPVDAYGFRDYGYHNDIDNDDDVEERGFEPRV